MLALIASVLARLSALRSFSCLCNLHTHEMFKSASAQFHLMDAIGHLSTIPFEKQACHKDVM